MKDLEASRRGVRPLTLANAGAGVLNYGFVLALGLLLPAKSFVVAAAAASLLLVVGTVAASSVPWLVAQEVVRAGESPGLLRGLARRAVTTSAVLGTVLGIISAAAASFASPTLRVLIGVTALVLCLGLIGVGWLQGLDQFTTVAALVVGEVVLKLVVGVGLVLAGAGATGAVGGALCGGLLLLAASVHLLRPHVFPVGQPSPVRDGTPVAPLAWRRAVVRTGGLRGALAALTVMDVVLVAVLLPASPEVAGYQLAMSVGRIPVFLATSVSQAYLGALTRAPRDGHLRQETLQRLLRLVLPLGLLLATTPRSVVALVSERLADSVTYLPVAALVGCSLAVVSLMCTWTQAEAMHLGPLRVLLGLWLLQSVVITVGAQTAGLAGVQAGASAAALLSVLVVSILCHRSVHLRRVRLSRATVVSFGLLLLPGLPLLWCALASAVFVALAHEVLRQDQRG